PAPQPAEPKPAWTVAMPTPRRTSRGRAFAIALLLLVCAGAGIFAASLIVEDGFASARTRGDSVREVRASDDTPQASSSQQKAEESRSAPAPTPAPVGEAVADDKPPVDTPAAPAIPPAAAAPPRTPGSP